MRAFTGCLIWFGLIGCLSEPRGDIEADDGLGDRVRGSRFDEVNPDRSSAAFRAYIDDGLDALAREGSELSQLTVLAIEAGLVKIDEFRDLSCEDFAHVRRDMPDEGWTHDDWQRVPRPGSGIARAIENAMYGYMWDTHIYVSRGLPAHRLASTLVHEVNHVANRSEAGYYDDVPTSIFVDEYRAFWAEAQFDRERFGNIDLVDYVLTTNGLDRTRVPASILADPLRPHFLPDESAWAARDAAIIARPSDPPMAECVGAEN